MTYTYAKLSVSEACYEEIRAKLLAAGYAHAFLPNREAPASPLINMHGIALVLEVEMPDDKEQPQ